MRRDSHGSLSHRDALPRSFLLGGAVTTRTGLRANSTNRKHTTLSFWKGDAMKDLFSREQRREFMGRGFTRRDFARLAAFMTAGATLPFYNEAALAQGLSAMPRMPADAVRINANENPMG